MITEERLKELIEQKATIYGITGLPCSIEEIDLGSLLYEEIGNWLYKVDIICYGSGEYDFKKERLYRFANEKLFETKEDAEFTLRYKGIPRTEYLDLPTWDEFNKDNFGVRFYNKSREFCLHKVRHSANDENPLWKIDLYESYGDDEDTVAWEKSWDLTKENYLEACELCKKLFLGEEDE